MTPEALAQLHHRAMTFPVPWNTGDFSDLLASPGVFAVSIPSSVPKYPGEREGQRPSPIATTQSAQPPGFALGRVILDEAELLTLAIDPDLQRQGLGRACLKIFETEAERRGATVLRLEVAETNKPARALYRSAGWQEAGRRKAYYKSETARIDAILMTKRPDSA